MTELLERYRRRPIRFIEVWEEADWRIKVYSITVVGGSLRPELLAAAKEAARRWLRQPLAPGRRHYGVGFMGVHEGPGANFVFLDWWADDNELYHQVYLSPADDPQHLQYVTPTGLASTVWDLRVLQLVLALGAFSVVAAVVVRDLQEFHRIAAQDWGAIPPPQLIFSTAYALASLVTLLGVSIYARRHCRTSVDIPIPAY